MNPLRKLLAPLAILALASTAVTASPRSAGVILIPVSQYAGHGHHQKIAAQEDIPLSFAMESPQSNGRFEANFNGVPLTGKVTASGKVTFSGQRQDMGGVLKVTDGVGQLTQSGTYFGGTFKLGGTLVPQANGPYTFDMSLPAGPLLPGSVSESFSGKPAVRFPAQAVPFNLGSEFDGHGHHFSNPLLESEEVTLEFTSVQSNGKFKGFLAQVPIHGKVTSTGKLTFSGKISGGGEKVQVLNGKAQLSATGLFLNGTYKISATGAGSLANGPYFFESNVV